MKKRNLLLAIITLAALFGITPHTLVKADTCGTTLLFSGAVESKPPIEEIGQVSATPGETIFIEAINADPSGTIVITFRNQNYFGTGSVEVHHSVTHTFTDAPIGLTAVGSGPHPGAIYRVYRQIPCFTTIATPQVIGPH